MRETGVAQMCRPLFFRPAGRPRSTSRNADGQGARTVVPPLVAGVLEHRGIRVRGRSSYRSVQTVGADQRLGDGGAVSGRELHLQMDIATACRHPGTVAIFCVPVPVTDSSVQSPAGIPATELCDPAANMAFVRVIGTGFPPDASVTFQVTGPLGRDQSERRLASRAARRKTASAPACSQARLGRSGRRRQYAQSGSLQTPSRHSSHTTHSAASNRSQ